MPGAAGQAGRIAAPPSKSQQAPVSTPTPAALKSDIKVIGLVSAAHGLSHFFQLVLPPLFPLMKDEFGASYATLGAVMAVFYTVSSFAQTASGFLVDRFGARNARKHAIALDLANRTNCDQAGQPSQPAVPPRFAAGGLDIARGFKRDRFETQAQGGARRYTLGG